MYSSLQAIAKHSRRLANKGLSRYTTTTTETQTESLYDALSGNIKSNAFQVLEAVPGKYETFHP